VTDFFKSTGSISSLFYVVDRLNLVCLSASSSSSRSKSRLVSIEDFLAASLAFLDFFFFFDFDKSYSSESSKEATISLRSKNSVKLIHITAF